MAVLNSVSICGLRFEVRTALTLAEEYLGCDTHRFLLEYTDVSPKRLLISTTLHGVTSQKTVYFNIQNVCEMVR